MNNIKLNHNAEAHQTAHVPEVAKDKETKPDPKTLIPALSVVRNGTSLTFEGAYSTRGTYKSTPYYSAQISVLSDYIAWKGENAVIDILQSDFNKRSQGWMLEATDEKTHIFDSAKFIKYAESDSARGDSVNKLLSRISELTVIMTDLLDEEDWSTNPDKLAKFKSVGNQVKSLQKELDEKKAKTAEDKAAEAAISEKE